MKIIAAKDYDHMSRQAANIISAQVILKPDSVLGLATGSSPVGIYKNLVRRCSKGDIDFCHVHTFNLDEYLGLGITDDQSYIRFMHTHFFDHINIDPERIGIPNGISPDPEKECSSYDMRIRSIGGIDLQLLGLGPNGHIGFNEPSDEFTTGTHITDLSEATIRANRRFFDSEEDVPKKAITMGIYDIIQARRIVMVVSGPDKASAVREAFFGPVTPRVPASILQLHRDFTLIADPAALSLI